MVENMKEESLIASRFVYDTVKSSAVHFSEIRLNPDWNEMFEQRGWNINYIWKIKENSLLKVKKLKPKNDSLTR